MVITEVTRRAILDELQLGASWWWGRLDEPSFLARLYPLAEMPSTDPRFEDAALDIWQHRERNNDWDSDWVFYDSRFELMEDDTRFLRFLAETVHPVVRTSQEEVTEMVAMYNRHLAPDGFELTEVAQISGRPIFAARERLTVPLALRQVQATIQVPDGEYLSNQITRMEAAIDKDPELAIGTAKELIETICKTILAGKSITPDRNWDLAKLVKETAKILKVTPDDVADDAPGVAAIRRTLGNLGGIVTGIAELRNAYGTGHGKPMGTGGLRPRHPRLAVGAASTLASFLFETYEQLSS